MNRSTKAIRFSAVLFTAAYLIAAFMPTLPEGAYSDARVLGLLDEGGSRTAIVLGGYAFTVAALAFVCFTSVLCSRLPVASRDDSLVSIGRATGIGYAVMLMVASTAFSSLPMGRAIGEIPASDDAMLYRVMSNSGFHALLVPGLVSAAVMVAVLSMVLKRTGAAPTWCAVAGFVIAPLLLLGVAWVPQFLVPLWVLLVGFGLRSAAAVPQVATRELAGQDRGI